MKNENQKYISYFEFSHSGLLWPKKLEWKFHMFVTSLPYFFNTLVKNFYVYVFVTFLKELRKQRPTYDLRLKILDGIRLISNFRGIEKTLKKFVT